MSRLSFLDLPEDIRFRVYRNVAWISNRVISLNNVKGVEQQDSNRLDCFGGFEHSWVHRFDGLSIIVEKGRDKNLRNLFLTCRKIYLEATRLVFSNSKTGVRNSEPGSIEKLLLLSPHVIGYLADLTIRLNDQVSQDARPNKFGNIFWVHYQYNLDLDAGSVRDKATVRRWRRCARYLFSNVVTSSLTLNFICETQSTQLAVLATEPFFSKVKTPLKQCNIRLSHLPRKDFQLLAKSASFNATGKSETLLLQTFPFTKLPKEIRLQILQYTDLVTLLGEVEWKQEYGFCMHYGVSPCSGGVRHQWYRQYPCQNGRKDGIYFEYLGGHLFSRHLHCKSRLCSAHEYTGCFCHRYHGAYTDNCRCWMPPIPFFLVSRAFREDSIEVFYSRNRFVVAFDGDIHQPADKSIDDTAIERFLTRVVPQSGKRFIKRLQIVFPPFPKEAASSHEPRFYQSWLRAISIMSSELSLPSLSLEVFVAGWHRWNKCRDLDREYYKYRKFLTEEQGQAVERAYVDFLKPVGQLKDLRDFFVFLDWPWYGKGLKTEWDAKRRRQIYEPETRSTVWVEKEIERLVMGEQYDSMLRGKGDTLDDLGWRFVDKDDREAQPWPYKHDPYS